MKLTKEDKKGFWWALKMVLLMPLASGLAVVHLIKSIYLGITASSVHCFDCWGYRIIQSLQEWHIGSKDVLYVAFIGYAITAYVEYKHIKNTGELD